MANIDNYADKRPSQVDLATWCQEFYLYHYCNACAVTPSNVGHLPKGCLCMCHIYAMAQWMDKHADELRLETLAWMVKAMEGKMVETRIPPKVVDEIRRMRDSAFAKAACKPIVPNK